MERDLQGVRRHPLLRLELSDDLKGEADEGGALNTQVLVDGGKRG
jgi:hypothetical protein